MNTSEVYRGYEIEVRRFYVTEGVLDYALTILSPTDELLDGHPKLTIGSRNFLPYVVDRLWGMDHMKSLVDKIVDHPEVRNLTLDEWSKWLGYSE